ncbi:MAG: LamG domain-containing protein [Chitinophagaceae bacterium]|nr:LamG domain-containing protein [Chitinophagaceae bacterium]
MSVPSPIRAYNFNGNAGDSAGSNHGTPSGGISYTTGKIGQAILFNDGNISIPNVIPVSDYAWGFWMYPIGGGTDFQPLLSYTYNNDFENDHYLELSYNQTSLRVEFDSNASASGTVALNTWTRVILKVSSNTGQFYINGIASGSGFSIPPGAAFNFYFKLANNTDWGENKYFGRIDLLYLWNIALNGDQILEDYNNGDGKEYPYPNLSRNSRVAPFFQ